MRTSQVPENGTPRRLRPPPLTPPPPFVRTIISNIARLYKITPSEIRSGKKCADVVNARAAVIRQLTARGHPQTQIGRWLGLHASSVNYYLRDRKAHPPRSDDTIPIPD